MRNHGYAIYSNSWQSIRQTTSYYIKKRNNFYGTYVLSYSHIKIRWWCRSMNPPLRISDSLEVDIGLSSSIRLSNILIFFFFIVVLYTLCYEHRKWCADFLGVICGHRTELSHFTWLWIIYILHIMIFRYKCTDWYFVFSYL